MRCGQAWRSSAIKESLGWRKGRSAVEIRRQRKGQRRAVQSERCLELTTWLEEEKGRRQICLLIKSASRQRHAGGRRPCAQVVFEFSSDLTVTGIDAERHPVIERFAGEFSELMQLALWLLAERSKGNRSEWHPFLNALPERTLSPLLWTDAELQTLCRGSPVVEEVQKRKKVLQSEWDRLEASMGSEKPAGFSRDSFFAAFSVVLAYAYYLPNAARFALLPPLMGIQRTGDERACLLDYNAETDKVTITAQTLYSSGDPIRICDGRPNSELFLTTGSVERDNPSDCIALEFELVPADRLYSAKRQILESLGYQPKETFPIYKERIPTQLLSFLRLSRLQDASLLSKVTFSEDRIISPLNEYEVLQLVLDECRVRLSEYERSAEDDIKFLRRDDLTEKQKVVTELLLGEKEILQSCVDIVRRKLAPIRGVPTKSGQLEDPNKDILDMFDAIESLPQAPKKLLDGIVGWARGDHDPDWNKDKKRP